MKRRQKARSSLVAQKTQQGISESTADGIASTRLLWRKESKRRCVDVADSAQYNWSISMISKSRPALSMESAARETA